MRGYAEILGPRIQGVEDSSEMLKVFGLSFNGDILKHFRKLKAIKKVIVNKPLAPCRRSRRRGTLESLNPFLQLNWRRTLNITFGPQTGPFIVAKKYQLFISKEIALAA